MNKEQLLFDIVKVLVIRIQKEVDQPTDVSKKNVILFKCWNTIRAICENSIFIPRFLNQIDELLLPLMAMIDSQTLLEFEEDIIEVLISTVTLSRTLAKNISKVVYLFPNIAKKFQDKAAQLYVAYNVLLNFGKQVFNDPQLINDMVDIAINAMSKQEEGVREYEDVFMTEGVMILHLAIHVGVVNAASSQQFERSNLD